MILSVVLFFITRNVNIGWLGFENIMIAPVPKWFYSVPGGFILGFPDPEFCSSDYFSVIPWFFLYASGYYFWKTTVNKLKMYGAIYFDVPILGAIGRKSLIIYMLHQPITMAFLELVSKMS